MAKSNAGVSLQAMQAEMAAKLAEFEARVRDAEKRADEAEAKAKAGNGKTAGISKDNLGRMAVQLPGSVAFSFYLDQWDKFEPQIEAAKAFIKANRKDMPDEATRKAASKVRDAKKAK
jgi:hypothetical protein